MIDENSTDFLKEISLVVKAKYNVKQESKGIFIIFQNF
jgi:hypothetical protein